MVVYVSVLSPLSSLLNFMSFSLFGHSICWCSCCWPFIFYFKLLLTHIRHTNYIRNTIQIKCVHSHALKDINFNHYLLLCTTQQHTKNSIFSVINITFISSFFFVQFCLYGCLLAPEWNSAQKYATWISISFVFRRFLK